MGVIGKPADRPYGERSAFVEDAFGNYWYIATRLASPRRKACARPWNRAAYCIREGARKYIDFLKRAFGAEEMAVFEHSGPRNARSDARRRRSAGVGRTSRPNGYPLERILFVRGGCRGGVCAGAHDGAWGSATTDIPYGLRSAIVEGTRRVPVVAGSVDRLVPP